MDIDNKSEDKIHRDGWIVKCVEEARSEVYSIRTHVGSGYICRCDPNVSCKRDECESPRRKRIKTGMEPIEHAIIIGTQATRNMIANTNDWCYGGGINVACLYICIMNC